MSEFALPRSWVLYRNTTTRTKSQDSNTQRAHGLCLVMVLSEFPSQVYMQSRLNLQGLPGPSQPRLHGSALISVFAKRIGVSQEQQSPS